MNGGCYSNDMPTTMENSRNCLRRIARHDDQEFSNQSILNAMEKFVKNVNTMDETILVPCRLMDRKVGDATDTVPLAPKAQHSGAHHGKKTNRASIREVLNTSELFQLYNMLKLVKVDLLWGRQDADDAADEAVVMGATTSTTAAAAATTKTTAKGRNSSNSISEQQSLTREGSPVATEKTDAASGSNSNSTSSSSSNNSNSSSSSSPAVSGTPKGHTRRPSTVSVTSSNSASTLSDSESEASAENDSGIESEGNQEQDRSAELAKQFRTHLLGLYRSLEQMSEAANYLTTRYQSDVGPV
uniref:Putative cell wall integrity and stress response component 1 n=1 Tax=Anopheles marajoara TaxID=58244 RepID=A0A2M4BVF5_9DIPT